MEALRGGYCVLIVGAFERFLRDCFSEHLSALVTVSPQVKYSALPKTLIESTIFESLDYAMKGPRHGKAGKGRSARLPSVTRAAHEIVAERVDPAALAQTKSNPDAETVRRMFRALGVPDPFKETRPAFNLIWAKSESASFVEDTLTAIVNQRHVVAHTANALAISRTDLSTWTRFLRALATVLDERLDKFVTNVISGTRPP